MTATLTAPVTNATTADGDQFHHHAIGPWTPGAVTLALCGYRRTAATPHQAATKPGCPDCEQALNDRGKRCLAAEVA